MELRDVNVDRHLATKLGECFEDNLGVLVARAMGNRSFEYAVIAVRSMDIAMRHPEWARAFLQLVESGADMQAAAAASAERVVRRIPLTVVDEPEPRGVG